MMTLRDHGDIGIAPRYRGRVFKEAPKEEVPVLPPTKAISDFRKRRQVCLFVSFLFVIFIIHRKWLPKGWLRRPTRVTKTTLRSTTS